MLNCLSQNALSSSLSYNKYRLFDHIQSKNCIQVNNVIFTIIFKLITFNYEKLLSNNVFYFKVKLIKYYYSKITIETHNLAW